MEEDYIGLEEDIAYESAQREKRKKRATVILSVALFMIVFYIIVTMTSFHG